MGKHTTVKTAFQFPEVDDDDLPLPEDRLFDDDGNEKAPKRARKESGGSAGKSDGDSCGCLFGFLTKIFSRDVPDVPDSELPDPKDRAMSDAEIAAQLFDEKSGSTSKTPSASRKRSRSGDEPAAAAVPDAVSPVPKVAADGESPVPKAPAAEEAEEDDASAAKASKAKSKSAPKSKSKQSQSKKAASASPKKAASTSPKKATTPAKGKSAKKSKSKSPKRSASKSPSPVKGRKSGKK